LQGNEFWGSDAVPGRLISYLVNSIFCLLYRKEYERFTDVCDVQKVQTQKLTEILQNNKTCEYLRQYEFNSMEDFLRTAPLTTYEDYLPYIARIENGEKNVLTTQDVLLLEPTSGSASATKLIPYTAGLKAEYQKGLMPWIYDLYSNCKGLRWGKSYWSVTPMVQERRYTKSGIPIGFEDDAAYFGKLAERLMSLVFAVPNAVAGETSMDAFYFKTTLALLKCRHLTMISVWNPTFFTLMLDYIDKNKDKLLDALPEKRCAELIKPLKEKAFHKIWPNLKLISCWYHANAYTYAQKLQAIFPNVLMQPKGLLATEGFISLPFLGEEGARLSVCSHFFEFLAPGSDKIILAHELAAGEEYEVILTTSGGLYRYRLGDVIKVAGFSGGIPRLKFIGRRDKVSDLFGEKLSELFVKNLDIQCDFFMLAPETGHYVLYLKADGAPPDVERQLLCNYHYKYCRDLGQLGELKVFRLTGNPAQEYLEECVRRGQKLGDIKPAALSLQGGWDQVFQGEYV